MAEFRRHHRILTAAQYKAVFDHRKRMHGTYFSVHLRANSVEFHRLGIAVSKKVSKKAVIRNAIKRQVRDGFRHFQSAQLSTTDAEDRSRNKMDMVVVAKPKAATADPAELRRELSKMWTNAVENANPNN